MKYNKIQTPNRFFTMASWYIILIPINKLALPATYRNILFTLVILAVNANGKPINPLIIAMPNIEPTPKIKMKDKIN